MAGSYSKEEQKRILRERTVATDELRSSLSYVRQERERARRRKTVIGLCAGAAVILAVCVYLWLRFSRYSTYDVDAELKTGGLANAAVEPFDGGCVVISADALTYVRDDKVVWTGSVKLTDPVFASEGNFFAVCSKGGYQACICDRSGILSNVKVSRHIRKMDISENGVLCVFTEADDAAYISFFDRFGTKTQAEVKTLISATGYPMDIAVSPDGSKLIAVYYSTENGIGESRLVCYDFENGKSTDNYIAASFDDYDESDTLLVDADFFTDGEAYVVGDHSVTFLKSDKKEIRRTVVEIGDRVLSVFRAGSRLGVIREENGANVCMLYDRTGKEGRLFEAPESFDRILADNQLVWFFDRQNVQINNVTGELRYQGQLSEMPISVCLAGRKSLILNTGAELLRLTYK